MKVSKEVKGIYNETFPIGTKLVFIGHQLQCFDEELTTITLRFFLKMKI
jgi:hypothetical protein